MNKYSWLTIEERTERIGELLAKAIYLYVKKQKEENCKSPDGENNQLSL